MAKKINTPKNVEIICKETLSKKLSKKSVIVRKSTQSGVGKSRLKSETKKLDTKLKAVGAIGSESKIDVTLKVRKSKVVTNAEARFNCPSADCD